MTIKVQLDVKSGVPFYRQVIDQVRSAMATGQLEPGDRLPTVRQLAVDLSVNPNTVSRAYTELELTGLVETQMGSGTFVGNRPVENDDFRTLSTGINYYPHPHTDNIRIGTEAIYMFDAEADSIVEPNTFNSIQASPAGDQWVIRSQGHLRW